MGRGAWRVQKVGDGLLETQCIATAAALDAIGARRHASRVSGGKTAFTFDVSTVREALAERIEPMQAIAAGDAADPADVVLELLADTMVGRFVTAFYTTQRHARRQAREAT